VNVASARRRWWRPGRGRGRALLLGHWSDAARPARRLDGL